MPHVPLAEEVENGKCEGSPVAVGAYSGRGQAQHQAAEACVPTLVRNIKRFSHLIGHKIKSELIKTLE